MNSPNSYQVFGRHLKIARSGHTVVTITISRILSCDLQTHKFAWKWQIKLQFILRRVFTFHPETVWPDFGQTRPNLYKSSPKSSCSSFYLKRNVFQISHKKSPTIWAPFVRNFVPTNPKNHPILSHCPETREKLLRGSIPFSTSPVINGASVSRNNRGVDRK